MTRYKARSVDYRVINIVKYLVIDCRWLDSIYRCVPGESNATCELRFFLFFTIIIQLFTGCVFPYVAVCQKICIQFDCLFF